MRGRNGLPRGRRSSRGVPPVPWRRGTRFRPDPTLCHSRLFLGRLEVAGQWGVAPVPPAHSGSNRCEIDVSPSDLQNRDRTAVTVFVLDVNDDPLSVSRVGEEPLRGLTKWLRALGCVDSMHPNLHRPTLGREDHDGVPIGHTHDLAREALTDAQARQERRQTQYLPHGTSVNLWQEDVNRLYHGCEHTDGEFVSTAAINDCRSRARSGQSDHAHNWLAFPPYTGEVGHGRRTVRRRSSTASRKQLPGAKES